MHLTQSVRIRLLSGATAALCAAVPLLALSPAPASKKKISTPTHTVSQKFAAAKAADKSSRVVAVATVKPAAPAKIASGPWRVSSYAKSADGDITTGDDLTARHAAVDALGPLNGSIVVSDADTGRVLTVVNQRLAYKSGYQPCSTVKVPVALAALSESLVDRNTQIRVYGRTTFTLTTALAKSNNNYFASLGEKLGFDRMSFYARLYGLGEKASIDIDAEQPGILPPSTPKSGMGMMTSFGDGITITPLEMASLMGAVANGGTMYYLQYPKDRETAEGLIPQVKRHLDIEHLIPEIKPGMMGAVEYGTARRIGSDHEEPIYGKTGTCTDTRTPTHLGWFGSFTQVGSQHVVVVVLLTGGKIVSGPTAAGVAGLVYKNLAAADFYAQRMPITPVAPVTLAGDSPK